MGREIRRVPANWQHPRNDNGRYIPLFDGCDIAVLQKEWDVAAEKWAQGLRLNAGQWIPIESYIRPMDFEDWDGSRPDESDYMPNWSPEEATHYMMYEDTTEGTPISPAFATPEEVARYCADNYISAFGGQTASYEAWLKVANGHSAISAVGIPGEGFINGVDALTLVGLCGQVKASNCC